MGKTIRVLTTLYNSEKYIPRTIKSLQLQTHKDFVCYITDDMSEDNSVKIAKFVIGDDPRFKIIKNTEKMYQPGNYWQILQREEIDDEDICVTVDGDDWLPNIDTLRRVLQAYEDKKTWMTYGQFVYYRGADMQLEMGFSNPPRSGIYNQRKDVFTTTHLRTFKAWLFRKIKKEDLMIDEKTFAPVAGDLFFQWPMLEMCGDEHSKFLQDINYVYNIETNLNDFKINRDKSISCEKIVRSSTPYQRII